MTKIARKVGLRAFLIVGSIAATGLGIAPNSQAATIFSQPLAASGAGTFRSDLQGGSQAADNFSVGGPQTVMSVHWWGTYDVNPTVAPNFQIRFFTETVAGSGVPAIVPFDNQTPASVTVSATAFTAASGRPVLDFKANLPAGLAINGATTYFVSIVDNAVPDQFNWSWPGGGGAFQRTGDGLAWNSTGINMAFELNNTQFAAAVPTPSAYAGGMLLLGVMGFAAKRRAKLATVSA